MAFFFFKITLFNEGGRGKNQEGVKRQFQKSRQEMRVVADNP